MARNVRTAIDAASVTTSASTLFSAWGQREVMVLKADSTNTGIIYLTFNGTTPTSSAYQLALSASEGVVLDRFPPGEAVQAIASTGTQKISGWEA